MFTRRNQNDDVISVSHDSLHSTTNMKTALSNEELHKAAGERDRGHFRYHKSVGDSMYLTSCLTPVSCDECGNYTGKS